MRAHVPGLALALIEGGRVASIHTYGERDTQHHPIDPDTVMYAASLTKAAFAYAAMMLVDDGRLDLDRPIARDLPKPLPEYAKYADLAGDPRWQQLTPRILLSHRGGFANYRFWPPGKDYDPHGKLEIYAEPGATFAYSGEGINLLQFALETGLGVDVADYLQSHLFDRLGMHRTSLVWRGDFEANYADGFGADGLPLPHERRTSPRAAGSLDTTIRDYAELAAAMVRGDGLKPATYRAWLAPEIRIRSVQEFPSIGPPDSADDDGIALAYALGVATYQSPRGPVWFKEGHDDGTNNLLVCVARSRDCLLVLSNSSNAESIFPYLIRLALGPICFPWYWDNYLPFDHPEWRRPEARGVPHPACLAFEPAIPLP